MTQATQLLPPWMSVSTSIFTVDGEPQTSTTLLMLPLTYYGPSIPLGTDGVWTYGGLVSPESSFPTAPETSLTALSPTEASPPAPTPPPPTETAIPLPPEIPPPSPPSPSPTSPPPTETAIPAPSAPPTATPPTTLSSPPTTVVTIPSASITSSSSLLTPSLPTLTSIVTSMFSSTTPFPPQNSSSPALPPGVSSNLSTNSVIGVVLGSILGSIFLLILGLFLINRYIRRGTQASSVRSVPIWTGWEIVADGGGSGHSEPDPGAGRQPGEGSPRASGEESDPFLRPSASKGGMAEVAGARLVTRRSKLSTGARPDSTGSSNSGYGNLLDSRDIGTAFNMDWPQPPSILRRAESAPLLQRVDQPQTPVIQGDTGLARTHPSLRGHIVPPSLLARLDEDYQREMEAAQSAEGSQESDRTRRIRHVESAPSIPEGIPEGYSPLIPPPLLDPDNTRGLEPRRPESDNRASMAPSTTSEMPEEPLLLTARRVRVEDLGPRRPSDTEEGSSAGPRARSSWSSLGLGGLSRLSRLSWFKNLDPYTSAPSRRNSRNSSRNGNGSRPTSFIGRGMTEADLEAGQSLLGPRKRSGLLGITAEGTRPMSSVSAKSGISGGTVYHDAPEEPEPGTPIPPLPPLPQAYFSLGGGTQPHTPSHELYQGEPPAYEDEPPTGNVPNVPPEVDILDIPAPPPASPFAETSLSLRSESSERFHLNYPPGLGLPTPRVWSTHSLSSDDPAQEPGNANDALDAEPPVAGEGWRSITSNSGTPESDPRRATFGLPTVIHTTGVLSEPGSLHSLRSRLSPTSRSTGSAPVSSRRAFSSSLGSGSASSRRGALSQGRSASSGASLARTGSLSSEDRRRRTFGPISPALSAFGRRSYHDGYLPITTRPPLGVEYDDILMPRTWDESTLGSGSATLGEYTIPAVEAHGTGESDDDWIASMPGIRWVNPAEIREQGYDVDM